MLRSYQELTPIDKVKNLQVRGRKQSCHQNVEEHWMHVLLEYLPTVLSGFSSNMKLEVIWDMTDIKHDQQTSSLTH